MKGEKKTKELNMGQKGSKDIKWVEDNEKATGSVGLGGHKRSFLELGYQRESTRKTEEWDTWN